MRAAPAFRERLSDFEAVSTGSFSKAGEQMNDRSHDPCRPGQAQPPPGKKTAQEGCLEGNQCLPGGVTLAGRSEMQPLDIKRLAAIAHNTQQHQEQVDEIQIQR